MARARKMGFGVIEKLGYFRMTRTTLDGVRGYYCWMNNRLSDGMEAIIKSYGNTRLSYGKLGCNKSDTYRVIFVGERCFPKSARA